MSVSQAVAEKNTLQYVMDVLLSLGGHTSPIPHLEEEIYRLRDNQRTYRVENIEQGHDNSMFFTSEPDGGVPGKVAYFLDTHQRTQLIGHFVTPIGLQVPVHYSIVMCLILERRNRNFKVWGTPLLNHLVLFPFSFLNEGVSAPENVPGISIVNTEIDEPEYTQIRVQSIQIAFREMNEMKLGLIEKWKEATKGADNEYLIHNGTPLEDSNARLDRRIIGWSKQIYMPFIGSKEANLKHLELRSFQRTAVCRQFSENDGGASSKYMWFIKLREHQRHGPEFGLVKPVIMADSDDEARAKAEWMTYMLLQERQPATFPAEGWDKLIFPIKLCRTYLDGIVPTHETIRSFFDRT